MKIIDNIYRIFLVLILLYMVTGVYLVKTTEASAQVLYGQGFRLVLILGIGGWFILRTLVYYHSKLIQK
jgi:hypothetical protein